MTKKDQSRMLRVKEMLLPLSASVAQTISLENHMSLVVMRGGHGTTDTIVALMRVLYVTFHLLERHCSAVDLELFLGAEAALDKSIRTAAQGCGWQLAEEWLPFDRTGSATWRRNHRECAEVLLH